ncbi:hypothetical protein CONPUDRAFT_76448 [Coniophora puteana RWD-64-598 SS2]|uniref:Uncharacterized protein n=1 Tax=Coniophora puteana (strain RWD-64-598) TaxID=741705 RepID=A0A5M3MCY2_CONPW|nr:uncharacterized protein CONPUDRAFT_76448 [Coniophora puteana RWD-64-598 SS2]EIW76896.1 hypothetical protein CONPUDRAFT_76448 [Coniophora puteana RWD-64-598 SS2]
MAPITRGEESPAGELTRGPLIGSLVAMGAYSGDRWSLKALAFGNNLAIASTNWEFMFLTDFVVYIYFAWKIWTFTRSIWPALLMILVIITRTGIGLWGSVEIIMYELVATGTLTSLLDIVALVLTLQQQQGLAYTSVLILQTRIYANSLLASVNMRKINARSLDSPVEPDIQLEIMDNSRSIQFFHGTVAELDGTQSPYTAFPATSLHNLKAGFNSLGPRVAMIHQSRSQTTVIGAEFVKSSRESRHTARATADVRRASIG